LVQFRRGPGSIADPCRRTTTEPARLNRRPKHRSRIENARILGANAIISMRFDSSEVGQGLTEIVAYGTAVVVGSRT
jgi:hypothetical protein